MARSFAKRQREVLQADAAAEREGQRRRVAELEAEVKLARSLGQARLDEAGQAHNAELQAVQRRVTELEEERATRQRSYEQRLAEVQGQRYGDSQERERRRIGEAEAAKVQLAEARREVAEAVAEAQAANGRAAALTGQLQTAQREALALQGQQQAMQASHAAVSPAQLEQLSSQAKEADERAASAAHARRVAERALEGLREQVASLEASTSDARCNLDEAEVQLAKALAELTEARSEIAELDEVHELDREEMRLSALEAAEERAARWQGARAHFSERLLLAARERLVRILFGAWQRHARSQRLLAARDRSAQLLMAADRVRTTAEAQAEQLRAQMEQHSQATDESIGAMRLEALSRAHSLEAQAAQVRELQAELNREVSAKTAARRDGEALEAELRAAAAKAETRQEKMSRRILRQLVSSLAARIFHSWAGLAIEEARKRRRQAEACEERQAALDEQARLRAELEGAAASAEEVAQAKKEAMARKLLRGCEQRRGAVVFFAWRALAVEATRRRERERIQADLEAAAEKAEALRLKETLLADTQKERIAAKVGKALVTGSLRRVLLGWHEVAAAAAGRREADRLRDAADERLLQVKAHESAAKLALVQKAFAAHQAESLLHVFTAWRAVASRAAVLRATAPLDEQLAAATAELANARRQGALLRQALEALGVEPPPSSEADVEALRASSVAIEAKAMAKMGNVLSMLEAERRREHTRRLLLGWRRVALAGKAGARAGSAHRAYEERDAVAAQLRLAVAGREAEARRVDMVRSHAWRSPPPMISVITHDRPRPPTLSHARRCAPRRGSRGRRASRRSRRRCARRSLTRPTRCARSSCAPRSAGWPRRAPTS